MVGIFFVRLRIFPASHTAVCDSTYSAAAARVLTISVLHLTGHWSYAVNINKYGFVEQNRCFLLLFSSLPLYLCKA